MAVFTSALMMTSPDSTEREMFVSNDQPESQVGVKVKKMSDGDFGVEINGPYDDTQTTAMRNQIYIRIRMKMEQQMVGADSRSDYQLGSTGITWNREVANITTTDSTTATFMPWGTRTGTSTATTINNGITTTGNVSWEIIGSAISDATNQYFETEWNGTYGNVNWRQPRLSPEDRIRSIIRERRAPGAIIRQNNRRNPLPMPKDIRERRARETMRRVLGDSEFRRFMSHGFVSIRAKSGYDYQIFPGHGITKVYSQGTLIERLCVVLRGNFCPTDSLMMRYLMILNDEAQFRSFAIKHSVGNYIAEPAKEADNRSLSEIFRELKQQEQKAAA